MYDEKMVISKTALVNFLLKHEEELPTVGCFDKKLSEVYWEVMDYPHPDGIPVEEYNGQKRWIYIHFRYKTCEYDCALWKFENRLSWTNSELYKEYLRSVYKGRPGQWIHEGG